MRAIHTYMGCIKAITNNWDIRPSVTVKVLLAIISWIAKCVKIARSRLHLFYFSLDLLFIFLFLEQLELGSEVIGHTVTSVTIWWHGHNIGYKTWENKVEGSRTNDVIQY